MKYQNKIFIALALLLMSISAVAQMNDYPQGYFRNPLDIPILLAGNFGECRPNHFHTGIDIKTQGKENMAVYAAADGYVSRITVSHSGYGNCVYITHPNGYITVYAHLNDFYKPLMDYVIQKQYEQETWKIDLKFSPEQFKVTKGMQIAYSGNTGGSTAPHLHFEIRDAKTEHVLNAGLFGFNIKDDMPPIVKSIAMYNEGSTYLQTPKIITVKGAPGQYSVADINATASKVYLSVLADDKMEGSSNSLGIYAMTLFLDDVPLLSWKLNEVNFDQNRYVNAFADYRLKEQKDKWFEMLYRAPMNKLDVYEMHNAQNGLLDLSDGKPHRVSISVEDFNHNVSTINFNIIWNGNTQPGSVCNNIWKANTSFSLDKKSFKFNAGSACIYDDVCMDYKVDENTTKLSASLYLGNSDIPLQDYATLALKLNQPLAFQLRSKLAFVHHIREASLPGNNPQTGMAAVYEDGYAKAQIRTFGSFHAVIDTAAPTIILPKNTNFSSTKSLSFTVTEKTTSVANVRPELDGKWLRFVRRGNTYTYTFDEKCPPGTHTLVVKAYDENNNEAIKTFEFTR